MVSLEAQLQDSRPDYSVPSLAAADDDYDMVPILAAMAMKDTFGPSMKLPEAADIHSPASSSVL